MRRAPCSPECTVSFHSPGKGRRRHTVLVSKFPFKPLLCVLKGFHFFFSLSVIQAKHCSWELLSYMSATCCSYRCYFCPFHTTGSPPRLPLALLSLSHTSPCVLPTVCQPQERHLPHLAKFNWFFKPSPKCPLPVSLPQKPSQTIHLFAPRTLQGLIILAHMWKRSINGRPELQQHRSGSSVTPLLPWQDDESTAQAAAMEGKATSPAERRLSCTASEDNIAQLLSPSKGAYIKYVNSLNNSTKRRAAVAVILELISNQSANQPVFLGGGLAIEPSLAWNALGRPGWP